MKILFYSIFIILCCFCSPITSSFASSVIVGDVPIWRSSINAKTKQIIINSQDNPFTVNLFIFSQKQSILQILYQKNGKVSQELNFLNFTLGDQIFTLKKQNINEQNKIRFDTILTVSQLEEFLRDFNTKEKAYITVNNDVISLSLQGSHSVISTLLYYLDKHPIPEFRALFNKVKSPEPVATWFDLVSQQNMLLYSMGFVVFLLLCGRPLFKLTVYFYKKCSNNYRKNKALTIAVFQIEQNANILHIKRDQLLYKDEYGSLIEDKWTQEIYRFIRTKIKPLLAEQKLLGFYPSIQKKIINKILYIAKYPPNTKKTFLKKTKHVKIKYSPTMNPFDYEVYCAELLRQTGWDADVTTASGDQGADVIAVKRGVTLILQCKLYSKPVGNKAVQEVNAAKIFYHAQYAVVVSNAAYTTSARQLADSTQVTLLHHETLQKFAQTLV